MQRLEVSGAVRPLYGSLGFKRLITRLVLRCTVRRGGGKNPSLFKDFSLTKLCVYFSFATRAAWAVRPNIDDGNATYHAV